MRKFQFEGKGNVSGDRVRELRLRARLSQTALAAKMQTEGAIIEQDAVSRIESGSRLVTDYELLVLTRIFHVSADWLIGADKNPPGIDFLRRIFFAKKLLTYCKQYGIIISERRIKH